ncbi:MAG TPA: hypothetical protein VE221_09100, partial [Sphingomicrobium sp.]|nr:hypothetical protein [Sphingomicrobium sp.]
VTTASQWWKERRPEIAENFEREVYGRVPANAPKVTWTVASTDPEFIAFRPVIAKQLIGHVDNSGDPAITVDMHMTLALPANAKGPVPVLIMFAPARYPSPSQPTPEEAKKLDETLKAMLSERDPSFAAIFKAHPGFELVKQPSFFPPPPSDERITDLIADGWGVALLDPATIQPDNGAGLRTGVIGLANRGAPRKPDDWGALRAWAWGASRALDYLRTLPRVDAKHIGIEGVSRYGKAALVTAAFDPRFYMVLVGSSGEGGAAPFRRNFGEAVENLTSSGEYHWMAGNFLKYAASDAKFGAKTANNLPLESDELIALVAPRLAFISYGNPAAGDALWLDQQGSYMATIAAGRAWTLLGAQDLERGNNYRNAAKPPIGTNLLDGDLAWRQHEGGHTDAPNMKYFLAWADRKMGRTPGR